jgi:tetratricopeptide (TPR) repeat protein
MESDKRKLETARALERRGQVDAAVKAYNDAGAPGEAGRALLDSLGVEPREVGRLNTTMRGRALQAAIFLAQGGQAETAVQVFLALGDRARALQTYSQLKKFVEAASLARRLGKWDEAGELYAQGGRPYEAALSFLEADDSRRALEQFLRVPHDHARYRNACVRTVELAQKLDSLTLEVERFLDRFSAAGPQDEHELAAFYALGRLYKAHGFPDYAKDFFSRVLALKPDYEDAAALFGSLEQASPLAADEPLPDLPEAPPLPDPTVQIKARITKPAPPASRASEKGPAFVVGATVADRYRLEEQIGYGGMSAVFRATDLDLGDEIALKVFTQAVQDEESEQRFKRELRLSRQLSDPHIVRLFDIGSYHGFRYISMELLLGKELRKRMRSPLAFAEGLDYLIQACVGLQAAHDVGIIHRDFKPENCFITTGGLVKVMDFGIAKVQTAPGLTSTGFIAGTPAYMSPEQIKDFSNVTSSTDLYAVGVVAYEMFTGKVPFSHSQPMTVLMMHLFDAPKSPRAHNPDIPQDLEEVILGLLTKEPAQRGGSCRELTGRLEVIRRRYVK